MSDEAGLHPAVAATRPLADRFHDAGHSLYLVGGVVRDWLLGRAYPEIDLTTDARPDQIVALLDGLADAVWTQGADYGTIGCRVGSQEFEITTHRADAYDAGSRKPQVAFGHDIVEDLARRDFTVNAMAVDLADGQLVDPHQGQADLTAGVLRTPLDPRISFTEDPLRMLRAARFVAGYGLRPQEDLTIAVAALVDRLDIVSVERITDELERLLLLDDPEPGFELMVSTGLWARLLPALDPGTAGRRARRVAAVSPAPSERWAALVSLPGDARQIPLKLSNARRRDLAWLLDVADRVRDELPTDDRGLRLLGELVPPGERLERAVGFLHAAVAADGDDSTPLEQLRVRVADLRSREPDFDQPVLPLDGEQVMEILGIDPGPEVGLALERLQRHRLDHGPLTPAEAAAILTSSR